jgi:hypothetical protein
MMKTFELKRWLNQFTQAVLLAALGALFFYGNVYAAPATTHPRLWITQADIPRLRSWAVPSNPMYANGLLPVVNGAINVYNAKLFPGGLPNPQWPDNGGLTGSAYPVESYASLFAFMSLVDNDPNARIQHAIRARNLLMYVINEAAKGHLKGAPYRDPSFATYDRSRWYGEGFSLAVDWIYNAVDANGAPILTAQDKATIRNVFMMWCNDNIIAWPLPPPPGVFNDPKLLKNYRETGNNYYSGHTRQIVMMSLAMDAQDDPPLDPKLPDTQVGNTLRSYFKSVVGTRVYQQYAFYEDAAIVASQYGIPATTKDLGIASGGLSPEGFLYGESLGFIFQGLLAMRTAGADDPAVWGPQVQLIQSKFWDKYVDSFLASLTPIAKTFIAWMGPVYQTANYGDVLRAYLEPTQGDNFAVFGYYDLMTGNVQRYQKSRWINETAMQGGLGQLYYRVSTSLSNHGNSSRAILHFMMFPPNSQVAPDPRPTLPTQFYDPGLGRLLIRTDWTKDATLFNFKCSWLSINHQNADCGQFEFYRQGEWLTKEHSNYDNYGIGLTTDYHNTLSLLNDSYPIPTIPAINYNWIPDSMIPTSKRGSQWNNGQSVGDPKTVASAGQGYAYAEADMTNLYNRASYSYPCLDILHASRNIVWLKPDHIVIYDRASSKTANRFKRFNLELVTNPVITGNVATQTLPSGQKLFIQSLLPANATLTASPAEPMNPVAELEPTQYRLVIEDLSAPQNTRFLHVLQGADPKTPMDKAVIIRSESGTPYEGVLLRKNAILFPVTMGANVENLTYKAPYDASAHLIAGLRPGAGYNVSIQQALSNIQVTVVPGSQYQADKAGLLVVAYNDAPLGLTPQNATFNPLGGIGSATVSTLGKVAWKAVSAASWITVKTASGVGEGKVDYSVAPNNTTSPRVGTITVNNSVLTIAQQGLVCTPSVSPISLSLASASGVANVNVKVQPGCQWTASSAALWATINSGASGVGDGVVMITVAANPTSTSRSATLTIAGIKVNLTQAGVVSSCSYSVTPTSLTIGNVGGNVGFNVLAQTGCPWTALSAASWATINASASGKGNGVVTITVASNQSSTNRTASLTIAGKNVYIIQSGANVVPNPCVYTLSVLRKLMIAGASTKGVVVTTTSACPWTATSNAAWLTVAPQSGKGFYTIQFTAQANLSATPRSALLTIANQTVEIIQAGNVGNGCIYALGSDQFPKVPNYQEFNSAGGIGNIAVSAPGGCSWTAKSNVSWVTITQNATNASGGKTVQFSVAPNTGASPRSGTLTLAGITFTVYQNGKL